MFVDKSFTHRFLVEGTWDVSSLSACFINWSFGVLNEFVQNLYISYMYVKYVVLLVSLRARERTLTMHLLYVRDQVTLVLGVDLVLCNKELQCDKIF